MSGYSKVRATRMHKKISRKILTMGGGGFSMEPENLLLDSYFFSMAEKKNPKVCFIGTASGDAQNYIDMFYQNMKNHEVQASHLSLFKGPKEPLRDFILDKDIFYVGGGNTRNLMVLWNEWHLGELLIEANKAGKVLGGISAGSLCWYEEGVTDSVPGQLGALKCLGILKGSHCPHYDGEMERRPAFHKLILNGMKDGMACDDGVAAVFEDEKFIEFISSRPAANGYFLKNVNGKIEEKLVKPRFLG
jgi:dipeptidase E